MKFSDVILLSNYHGCKGEVKKLSTTLYDTYYSQNCKAITFRKITNQIQNINKLMFQVIFIFSS